MLPMLRLGKRMSSLFISLLAVIFLASQACAPSQTSGMPGAAPSIEGTYRLVSRELPDGTKQAPPVVLGLLTYTKQYRHFNVSWKDMQGKSFSVSYMATYKLTEKEYAEKSLWLMVNDEISGKGLSYDLSGPSGSAPVTVKDGRLEIPLPLYGEPFLVFEGDKFKATRPGVFIDYWEKVK
jgi:hypothetical protein